MAKHIPTIYDVAARAGVSISTASRVLNDPNKVSEKTRTAVLSAIEQLGFVPKADARARALGKSRRVDVITPFFTAPSFVQRLRGVAAGLTPLNYELVIHTVESVSHLNNHLMTLPMRGDLDGLIIIALNIDETNAARLLQGRLETVLIECHHDGLCSIEIDDVAGGRMVANYLVAKGHRRFAFIGDSFFPDYGVHPISKRLVGFRQALAEKDIDLPDERVHLVPVDVETTRQHVHRWLEMAEPPTAVFAATDLQAIGVLQAARDCGLRMPDDLAVIGFDNLDISKYIGLTTVCQHLDESGKVAVEMLLFRLSNSSRAVQHVELPLEIIERETA
jgi:DNA-binding LacI/PurR family transcriptional regulator